MCVLECVVCMCTLCLQIPLEVYFKPRSGYINTKKGLVLFLHTAFVELLTSLLIFLKLNLSESLTSPSVTRTVSWALLCIIKNVTGLPGLASFLF